jgi:hypothetical protein
MLGDERSKDVGGDAQDYDGAVDKPRRGRPPNKLKEQPVEQQGFTLDQVLELLNHQSIENQKNLLAAIQELKKPSPEEQAKIDKEKAKLQERTLAAAKLAMAEEQGKKNAAKMCPHGTIHHGTKAFTHQWRAQVMTPAGERPYYIPRCTQCGSTWDRVFGLSSPKILATAEQQKEGVNMCDWSMEDIRRVAEWAKQNPVEEMAVA